MIDQDKLRMACEKAGCVGMTEIFNVALGEKAGYDSLGRRFQLPCGRNTYYRLLQKVRSLMEGSEGDSKA